MIGEGRQHWVTVHVADLADFFRRALEELGGVAELGARALRLTLRAKANPYAGRKRR